MLPTHNGSFRLFRFAGIAVFLHWSWLLVAFYQIEYRRGAYGSIGWTIAEYLALFVIVLLHEFGHALACRSVGGVAERIVLWPLGGIAYVNPPPRPGALLWSIAAGPLVNLILVPMLFGIALAGSAFGLGPDARMFLARLWEINLILFVFNMFPIFPLDGGQILRALLWFGLGRARSLTVASVIGVAGAIGGFLWAVATWGFDWWLAIIGAFVVLQGLQGFKQARILARFESQPRHERISCPACGTAPFRGEWWSCGKCGHKFDIFATRGRCPSCGTDYETAACPECRRSHPIDDWLTARD